MTDNDRVSDTAALPRPASTVVLARPAHTGFEIFLVRRHDAVAFMGGAHVFPGGRVDEADCIDDPATCGDGVELAAAGLKGRAPEEAVAFHVAAIRELFEEAGVLLARDAGASAAAAATSPVVHRDADVIRAWRRELLEGRMTIAGLARRERLRLALDALTPFAHWVTPALETRRFDTHFFFASVPPQQQAVHDDSENAEGLWIRPGDAIDAARRGDIALPPPTWTVLRALMPFTRIEEARSWARAQRSPRIEPRVAQRADGTRVIMLPGDPGCPAVEGFDAPERRFILVDGRWQPIEESKK